MKRCLLWGQPNAFGRDKVGVMSAPGDRVLLTMITADGVESTPAWFGVGDRLVVDGSTWTVVSVSERPEGPVPGGGSGSVVAEIAPS